ncbi:Os03g0297850, partial [Oryza sativa Japonica Group]
MVALYTVPYVLFPRISAVAHSRSSAVNESGPSKWTSLPPPSPPAPPEPPPPPPDFPAAALARAPAELRRHGAGEAVVEEVDAPELGEEAEGGRELPAERVVVEAELAERRELADLVGERAGEALEGELDGDHLPLRALDPGPPAGARVEPRAVP